jgi:signal transduction histidine kinase
MDENRLTDEQLEQLLEVGRSLVSELDLEVLLRRVLEAARDLTGAAYAALGILNEDKTGLERFIHSGIDEETRRAIGPLPRGRGVLGELMRRPSPLRLADVNTHPSSYGFPPAHPEMKTFLGTPVLVRGEAWGNLYLTEKEGGAEFTEGDEQLAVVLAAWAGVALENVRLYDGLRRRRVELETALRGLEASTDISRTVAGGIEVDELLELIAKRGRGVVEAHRALVLLSDGGELEIVAAAGEHPEELVGERIGDSEASLAELYRSVPDLQGLQTLASPLAFRERLRGMLVAVDHPGGRGFDANEQHAFDAFAASAATTIATVEAAETEKLKLSIEASERERRRWARELHDETLQELGALRFVLETAGEDASALPADLRQGALEHVNRSIRNLQGLITELRPSVLDELGVKPAIETLVRESAERSGIEIEVDVRLASEGDAAPRRLAPDIEATIYRLVQEGLNNAIKHAAPDKITVAVTDYPTTVVVAVTDDGRGFDPKLAERSFGLIGMEERVALAGGTLRVESAPGEGTEVRAELPLGPDQEGASDSHRGRPRALPRPRLGR